MTTKPPVYVSKLEQTTTAMTLLGSLTGVKIGPLLGVDRFLERGRRMHMRYLCAQLALDAWPKVVRCATHELHAFHGLLLLATPQLQNHFKMVRACTPLMNALDFFVERTKGFVAKHEITAKLDPRDASASQLLFALVEDGKAVGTDESRLRLTNCLEYALWADERVDSWIRRTCPETAAGVEGWYTALIVEPPRSVTEEQRAFQAFMDKKKTSADEPDNPTTALLTRRPLAWINTHTEYFRSILISQDGNHRASACFFDNGYPQDIVLTHAAQHEALFLVRVLAALLEAEKEKDYAPRLRAVADYGFTLDVSYLQDHVTGTVRQSIAQSELLLNEIWTSRVLDGAGSLESALQARLHEATRAAALAASGTFSEFFSMRRVLAMTIVATAALACDMGLVRIAEAHRSPRIRQLARPALWMMYPLIALLTQRALSVGGLWPSVGVARSRGLFVAQPKSMRGADQRAVVPGGGG